MPLGAESRPEGPFFERLPDDLRAALTECATQREAAPGEVLFYPGDPPDTLYALRAGAVEGGATPGLLDARAALGGLPHTHKATISQPSRVYTWSAADFWAVPGIEAAARAYLARGWEADHARLSALQAPLVAYDPRRSQGLPGPFIFEDVTMLFAFCQAARETVTASLPPGLELVKLPGKASAPVLVALADFPRAYAEADPAATFGYTETTFFIPVRYKSALGLFVPLIFPSAYEPILLGRELYGFPKQLARTDIQRTGARLATDHGALSVAWARSDASSESDLVGGLMGWLGLVPSVGAVVFNASELVRWLAGWPATRRVDVYNHKRIPAAESTRDVPAWAVDELTRATFGVLRWYHIEQAADPHLMATGPLFDAWGLTVERVYRTQLAMRLSTGRTVQRYA